MAFENPSVSPALNLRPFFLSLPHSAHWVLLELWSQWGGVGEDILDQSDGILPQITSIFSY